MKYSDIINNSALMTLRSNAMDANKEYGVHINDTEDRAEVERLGKVVADRVAKYNDACKAFTFDAWLKSDTPMKSALLDGVFPVLKASVKGKTDSKTTEIADETRIFNVVDFISYAVEKGYDNPAMKSEWLKQAEEAHKALCGYIVTELQRESLKSQFINEFDISFAMKAGDTTCGEPDLKKRFTKGNIDRTLQALLDAILYEDATDGGKNAYRILNMHRNALLYTYAKLSNKVIGEVLFRKTNQFMTDVTKVFCTIVRGTDFSVTKYPVASEK